MNPIKSTHVIIVETFGLELEFLNEQVFLTLRHLNTNYKACINNIFHYQPNLKTMLDHPYSILK